MVVSGWPVAGTVHSSARPTLQLKARTVAAARKTASEAVIIRHGFTARSLVVVAVASLAAGDLSYASIKMGGASSRDLAGNAMIRREEAVGSFIVSLL
jgi:hypothetical protein